ncbi:TetR/AcrR family transcriptional regulator [Nocardia farcinica]|uniref:TetR/AcrR family transcriptional regulator n=1 Tax=Nocardia farcinica TaxID=37329 RepID=UPI001894ACF4|nr:TetR/AcrR family transcriptional regulator [Nocardia farcinica]MBF6422648.1 TetR/AcrR family transcriptional regulator [Nocardia farcinica]MBF6434338.1 TetR/AcrR family transcriptional regulator [Nocardia farcinica]MBF6505423.1 TetR/AcrR family transcriptional regulator [Nocardia farcinica]
MPKLWNETIASHRHAVREAVLDAAAAVITESGLAGVSMSKIAERTGIGRATLYKYFPDAEAILAAWHDRQITRHLQHLAQVRDRATGAGSRLEAVLGAYAQILAHHPTGAIVAGLHRGNHVEHAQHRLHEFVRALVTDAAQVGEVRDDVPADELTGYVLHAVTAAEGLDSPAAADRLVALILTGLAPQQGTRSPRPPSTDRASKSAAAHH